VTGMGKRTPATAPKRVARNTKSTKDLYDLLIDRGVSEYNAKLITEHIKGAPIKGLPIEPIKKVKKKNDVKLKIYNDTKYRHLDIAFIEVISKLFELPHKLPPYIVSDKDKKIRFLLRILIKIYFSLPEELKETFREVITRSIA
jgi:hypothetical protein